MDSRDEHLDGSRDRRGPVPLAALTEQLSGRLCQALEDVLQVRPRAGARRMQLVGPEALREGEPTCRFELCCRLAADGTSASGLAEGIATNTSPLRPAHLELSPSLADAMIDLLLGAAPRPLVRPRGALTAVDRRLLANVVEHIVQGVNLALAPAGIRLELPPEPAPQAAGTGRGGLLLDLSLELHLGNCRGTLRLVLAAEALAELCPPGAPGRRLKLTAAVQEPLDEGDLGRLAAGDVLVTDAAAGEVIVYVDGQPRFAGTLGQYNGHRAVTITRRL